MGFRDFLEQASLLPRRQSVPSSQIVAMKEPPFTEQQIFFARPNAWSETLVVEVPHVPEQNRFQEPIGPLGAWAVATGYDFVRLANPAARRSKQFLTSDWVESIEGALKSHDVRHMILVSAYKGAGLLPYLAKQVNDVHPGRVVGLFGLCARRPIDLLNAIQRHDDFEDTPALYLTFRHGIDIPGRTTVTQAFYHDLKQVVEKTSLPMTFNGHAAFTAEIGEERPTAELVRSLGFRADPKAKLSWEHVPRFVELSDKGLRDGLMRDGAQQLNARRFI